MDKTEVKEFVRKLIMQGVDVDSVYEKVKEAYGTEAVRLVPDCYFEAEEV